MHKALLQKFAIKHIFLGILAHLLGNNELGIKNFNFTHREDCQGTNHAQIGKS